MNSRINRWHYAITFRVGAICAALFGMHLVMEVPPLVHGVILGVGSGFAMVSIQMQWGLVGEKETRMTKPSMLKMVKTMLTNKAAGE